MDKERAEVPTGQSAQQRQTHLDSVFMVCTTTFTCGFFSVTSMLHFVDQWIVIVSNMNQIFGSMISVHLGVPVAQEGSRSVTNQKVGGSNLGW